MLTANIACVLQGNGEAGASDDRRPSAGEAGVSVKFSPIRQVTHCRINIAVEFACDSLFQSMFYDMSRDAAAMFGLAAHSATCVVGREIDQ